MTGQLQVKPKFANAYLPANIGLLMENKENPNIWKADVVLLLAD